MSFFQWLKGGSRSKALAHYRQGMNKAAKRDHRGAIDAYSAAIDVPGAPADVKAMALYNRALVYVTAGDAAKGTADLKAVLAMPEAVAEMKMEARRKLVRIQRKASRDEHEP